MDNVVTGRAFIEWLAGQGLVRPDITGVRIGADLGLDKANQETFGKWLVSRLTEPKYLQFAYLDASIDGAATVELRLILERQWLDEPMPAGTVIYTMDAPKGLP